MFTKQVVTVIIPVESTVTSESYEEKKKAFQEMVR